MKEFFYKIFYFFNQKLKFRFYLLITFTVIASLLEFLSLATLFPSIIIITSNESVYSEDNSFINLLNKLNLNFENPVLVFIGLFFLIYIIKLLFFFFIILLQNNFIYSLKKDISDKIAESYLKNDLLLQIKKKTSNMISILTDEIAQVGQIYFHLILIITDIFLILSISIFLLNINFQATLIIFLILLLTLIVYQISVKKIVKDKAKDRQHHFSNRIHLSNFIIKAFKEIKIFKKESYFLEQFNLSTVKNFKSLAIINIIQSLPRLFIELILLFLITIFLLYIFFNDYNLEKHLPVLGIYLFACIRLMPIFVKFSSSLNLINFFKPSLDIIFKEILDSKIKKKNYILKEKKIIFNKEIVIKNVSFSYSSKKVINNINFKIKKNNITIIAGRSGSGKTTLLNILMGLITSYNGTILIDKKNLKDFRMQWINNLAYIPQDINLMNKDIRSNIAFGESKKNVDNKKIYKIIKLLNFKSFIDQLSKGLNTKVGDHGKYISGGQIQKIAIARALYKESETLIFDEPTSSLDKNSVYEFIKNIKKIKNNKTIIIVTHDPMIIKSFKNVILMNN